MTLIEVIRNRQAAMTRQDVRSVTGSAQLVMSGGRRARVDGQLSMSRTFFSLSGGGSFICAEDIAFDAVNSPNWLKLVFDEGTEADISIYKLRSGDSRTQCWFEVQG